MLQRGQSYEAVYRDFRWIIPGTTKWSKTYDGKEAVANDLMRPLRGKIEGAIKTRAQRIIADGDFVAVAARLCNIPPADWETPASFRCVQTSRRCHENRISRPLRSRLRPRACQFGSRERALSG